MAGEDFVQVRLTKSGEEIAAGAPLRAVSGHHIFEFTAGESQRVTRAFDWQEFLSKQHIDGAPLFELASEEN